MSEKQFQKWMRLLYRFLLIFVMNAFTVSCSFLLFFSDVIYTREQIEAGAKMTFINIFVLTVFGLLLDMIHKKITIHRPVQRINQALDRIMKGDFSVKIEPMKQAESAEIFNPIIEHINQMTDELNSVETLRTDFISNVSHELKTPLSVISNTSVLLQNPSLSDEKRQEYAQMIGNTSKNLASLVSNVLKLNRLENQKIYPENVRFDLSEQLIECILSYESEWEKKQLEIETDIEENVHLAADKELLAIVWNNLLSNAVKFTDEHGKISVRLKKEGTSVIVSVKDTGIGMSTKVGQHIFEKFYQGDTSRSTQGNGLGLAMVKKVIELFKGEIFVRSEVGKGTEFTVVLNTNENE